MFQFGHFLLLPEIDTAATYCRHQHGRDHYRLPYFTTMIGFGGWLLSMHPGLHSIGQLAVVGIGLTLVAALVFLPALLQWGEEWRDGRGPNGAELNGEQQSTLTAERFPRS